jgi:quinol monooxygenase YgiN
MLIAIVTFQTLPDNRAAALAALLDETATVRAMPGCQTYQPLPHPDDPATTTILHVWDDATAFAAYLGSAGFAAAGQALRPLMTAPPVSQRFDADLIETVA